MSQAPGGIPLQLPPAPPGTAWTQMRDDNARGGMEAQCQGQKPET